MLVTQPLSEPGGTSEARLGVQVSLVSKSNIWEWGLGLAGGTWGKIIEIEWKEHWTAGQNGWIIRYSNCVRANKWLF